MTGFAGGERVRRAGAYAVAALIVMASSAAAFGQAGAAVTFGWTVGGQPRSVTLTEVAREGVSYVSLSELARALGAGFRMEDNRVQLDLVGQTAWAPIDGAEVYGSLSRMNLTFPIRAIEGQAYLAKNDVAPLFRTCFRVALTTASGQSQAPTELAMPELEAELARLTPAELDEAVAESASPTSPGPVFRRIVIDPGHGGGDGGATGPAGTAEKDVALAVAKLLKAELEKTPGVSVWLTRSDDVEVGASARARAADENGADLFVSIHTGASLSPDAQGVELFYPLAARTTQSEGAASSPARSRKSEALARRIETALIEGTGRPSRGIRSMPLRTAPPSEAAAVAVELGCLTTATEESVLRTAEFHQRAAAALAAGIQTPAGTAP